MSLILHQKYLSIVVTKLSLYIVTNIGSKHIKVQSKYNVASFLPRNAMSTTQQ